MVRIVTLLLAVAAFAGCNSRPTSADLTEEERKQGLQWERDAAVEFYDREKARIEGDGNLTEPQKRAQMSQLEGGFKKTKKMLEGEEVR